MPDIPPELYTNDPDLQGRVVGFITTLIDEAETILERANPNMKVAILRSWLPAFLREMSKANQSDEIAELRKEMFAMIAEMNATEEAGSAGANGKEPHPGD